MTHYDHIFVVEVDGDNQHGITTRTGNNNKNYTATSRHACP